MKENEIIQYLKNNRSKGVAFAFMPESVKEWCRNRYDRSIFMVPFEDYRKGCAEEFDVKWWQCRKNHTILVTEPLCLVDTFDGKDTPYEIARREYSEHGNMELLQDLLKKEVSPENKLEERI